MPGAQQLPPQPRPGAALDYETFKTTRAADPDGRAQGQRALPVVPFARRRQLVSRTARAGRRDVHRRADAPEFRARSKLVVPGEPLKSILLINPLAEEAGGSHWHGGGKHWQSQSNPEWQTLAAWVKGGRR